MGRPSLPELIFVDGLQLRQLGFQILFLSFRICHTSPCSDAFGLGFGQIFEIAVPPSNGITSGAYGARTQAAPSFNPALIPNGATLRLSLGQHAGGAIRVIQDRCSST